MASRDSALLIVIATATVLAAAVSVIRRRRGSSRAVATFAAGTSAGCLMGIAFLVAYDQFFPPRASIGLERLMTPVLTVAICTVGTAIMALCVHVWGGRSTKGRGQTMSVDAHSFSDTVARRPARPRSATPASDWRDYAARADDGEN